jgi:gamma-glutamyl-gamma-aminobutyrate hydrolase PuuD
MRMGIAHRAFFGSFAEFYPKLQLIKDRDDVKNYDLIIFSGGEDIDPQLYHEENVSSYCSPERDAIEIPILEQALRIGKKILGVCRGHQLINAYLGGSLYQDISMAGYSHRGSHAWKAVQAHDILKILPSTINSMHHQGVKTHGDSMKIIVTWNGISEVSASTDNNIITVQFHPEFMGLTPFFEYITQWSLETSRRMSSSKKTTSISPEPSRTSSNPTLDPVIEEQLREWRTENPRRVIHAEPPMLQYFYTTTSTDTIPHPQSDEEPG